MDLKCTLKMSFLTFYEIISSTHDIITLTINPGKIVA